MLVDSGADISLLPKSVGDELGLEIEHEERIHSIQGLGGKVPVIYRNLIIKIGKEEFSSKVGWVLIDGFPPILGREIVFNKFHIEFLQDRETVNFYHV